MPCTDPALDVYRARNSVLYSVPLAAMTTSPVKVLVDDACAAKIVHICDPEQAKLVVRLLLQRAAVFASRGHCRIDIARDSTCVCTPECTAAEVFWGWCYGHGRTGTWWAVQRGWA